MVEYKYDTCILCEETTEYAEMDPVTARSFYVEGVGQLCQSCLDKSTHEEQMIRYEASLKESDWGHQPG